MDHADEAAAAVDGGGTGLGFPLAFDFARAERLPGRLANDKGKALTPFSRSEVEGHAATLAEHEDA